LLHVAVNVGSVPCRSVYWKLLWDSERERDSKWKGNK